MKNVVFSLLPLMLIYSDCIDSLGTKENTNTIQSDTVLIKYIPDIENAVDILSKDSAIILKTFHSGSGREILSVGFPEVIRWNEFQDVVEIASNKLMYTKYGHEYADFSVGIFQMKPSFVEAIEHYCINYLPQEQKIMFKEIIVNDKDISKNRAIRLQRLEERVWQLKYLQLYWYVANHKFRSVRFKNQEQRIRFYASAYNYGFTKPVDEIVNWQLYKIFPFGRNYTGQQLSYSDVSMAFFNTYFSQIFFKRKIK